MAAVAVKVIQRAERSRKYAGMNDMRILARRESMAAKLPISTISARRGGAAICAESACSMEPGR